MRYIEFEKIVESVESLCIKANYELPDDVLAALTKAAQKESNPAAAKILHQLIENARIAAEEKIPLCQDTGLAVVFVEQGEEVIVKPRVEHGSHVKRGTKYLAPGFMDLAIPYGTGGSQCGFTAGLFDAINAGVKAGYEKGYLRMSVVADPLNKRTNTGSNTPAIIHHTIVQGDKLKLTFIAKGGGCENKSQVRMFKPTAEKKQIIDWVVEVVRTAGADACPPFIVGVGIGGDFELSCLLSKKALLRNLASRNADEFYASLEDDLLSEINALGTGPQGLGGDTTALAVFVETSACHIASLPVAVSIECHSHRHKTVII